MRGDHEPPFEPRFAGSIGAQELRDRLDRWLDRQDVEPGGGDMLVTQRVVERVEIDDCAARVVNDDRVLRQ